MSTSAQDEAFRKVCGLVNNFQAKQDYYLSSTYQEAEVRQDFLNKFFIALGWDVNHEHQQNPYEQEVKVERGVAVGPAQRRADYAFHIAPNFRDPRFMVEAKKPAKDLANADDYFQTIRYGFNKDNPLAALCDFEELHILDSRYEPDIETALNRRVKKYHYLEYADPEKFAEIYWLLSRDAVAGGSLEKFAETLPKPRGKQRKTFPAGYRRLDESFLAFLDEQRLALAKAFKKENPDFDSETLTEIAQRTLDRLVFMRFFEDKLIEPEHVVAHFAQRGTCWRDFSAASRRLDGVYNGIIFKRHAIIDCDNFSLDEDAFAGICRSLSDEHSPYDFNLIPIHILGSIYERFLGNVIVATDKRVRIEPKPEVRKAGGVYYTPDYIVQYIVGQTVGKLIEGKTPAQIAELRFADIACGSGSFLLGVYDLLLHYHARWYNDNPTKAKKGDCVTREGVLALSLDKKRQILLNNIYGVDIDFQAVEVTQLSLYLKLLEEETIGSTQGHQREMHTTILPSLDKNIVCGNSLVGWDIINGKLFPEEEKQLNPMNFEEAIPAVMTRGGFDAVVGNPPYGATIGEREANYIRDKFETTTRDFDTYALFIEQAVKITRPGGMVSMIVPTGWYSGVKFGLLRRFVACACDPQSFVNLPYDVFHAWVDTTVFVGIKRESRLKWPRSESCNVTLLTFPKRHKIASPTEFEQGWKYAELTSWFAGGSDVFLTYADDASTKVVEKIQVAGKPFSEQADIQRGVTPFKLSDRPTHKTSKTAFDGTVRRYTIDPGGRRYVRFDDTLAEPKPERYFLGPRLLLRELISRKFQLQAVRVDRDFVTNKSMQSILQAEGGPDLNYLLGILNSRLMSWYFLRRSNIAQRDDFPKIVLKETRSLPIRPINLSAPTDKSHHDRMVRLVEQMLNAKQRLAAAKTDNDRRIGENKCAHLDREIDALVYDLYGLTAEEIKIVEGE